MSDPIGLLELASAKARYAAARQSVIAGNVANADTPGYRSKDVEQFSQYLTRAASAGGRNSDVAPITIETSTFGAASPNRNTVSLETELMRAGEAARDHGAATAIYAKAISFLRAALGKPR